jgi:hypothetical protein
MCYVCFLHIANVNLMDIAGELAYEFNGIITRRAARAEHFNAMLAPLGLGLFHSMYLLDTPVTTSHNVAQANGAAASVAVARTVKERRKHHVAQANGAAASARRVMMPLNSCVRMSSTASLHVGRQSPSLSIYARTVKERRKHHVAQANGAAASDRNAADRLWR